MGYMMICIRSIELLISRQPPIFLPTALCRLPTDRKPSNILIPYPVRHLRLNLIREGTNLYIDDRQLLVSIPSLFAWLATLPGSIHKQCRMFFICMSSHLVSMRQF